MTRRLPPAEVGDAGAILRAGGLVAFPTETVYGLGADATDPAAVARIYAAKGRPVFNPLIAHVASLEAATGEGEFTPEAFRLAAAFWPGPLTLVVPRSATGSTCDLACAGLPSIGLRWPAHPIAQALLHEAGRPVAAPSANRSGHVSPTEADHVLADLNGSVDAVLDGGRCPVGIESTIVACLAGSVTMLRPGGVPLAAIEDALGSRLDRGDTSVVQAPGMLASHYAPRASLRLDALHLMEDEVGLDFGNRFGGCLDLSITGDTLEAAANLYRHLRLIDGTGATRIAIALIPNEGLGAAINDRLRRAAAPRS